MCLYGRMRSQAISAQQCDTVAAVTELRGSLTLINFFRQTISWNDLNTDSVHTDLFAAAGLTGQSRHLRSSFAALAMEQRPSCAQIDVQMHAVPKT